MCSSLSAAVSPPRFADRDEDIAAENGDFSKLSSVFIHVHPWTMPYLPAAAAAGFTGRSARRGGVCFALASASSVAVHSTQWPGVTS